MPTVSRACSTPPATTPKPFSMASRERDGYCGKGAADGDVEKQRERETVGESVDATVVNKTLC